MWWLAHGQDDPPRTLEWLSLHEREHLRSIRFTKRRDEYLTRRWTAKQTVATVLDVGRTAQRTLCRGLLDHRGTSVRCEPPA
jgi:hypothetical protein